MLLELEALWTGAGSLATEWLERGKTFTTIMNTKPCPNCGEENARLEKEVKTWTGRAFEQQAARYKLLLEKEELERANAELRRQLEDAKTTPPRILTNLAPSAFLHEIRPSRLMVAAIAYASCMISGTAEEQAKEALEFADALIAAEKETK